MIGPARLLLILPATLLAACAGLPSQAPSRASDHSLPAVAVATPAHEAGASPARESGAAAADTDTWAQLRSTFDMPGCDADPAVLARATRYTRHPRQFEREMRSVLPRLVYVQEVARNYDVAGEFVLLPWVESNFRPVGSGPRRQSAGMWQIVPSTAGAIGLHLNNQYDGRFDIPAATHAVMKLLEQYHQQFGDWRVVDYAYNAGEFAVRRVIRAHGLPPAQPTIPDWPIRKVTREHLTKLLAIACVVRDPQRFAITLPTLPPDERLVQTALPHPMSYQQAASRAGMSVADLKHLNAGFRGQTMDPGVASYLVLPARHARRFHDVSLQAALEDKTELSQPHSTQVATGMATPPPAMNRTYRVRAGDSLWKIARDHAVQVRQLQRWNRLTGSSLKPGQTLVVAAPN